MDPGDITDGNVDTIAAGLDQIGWGFFRRVYALNDDWVLKLACPGKTAVGWEKYGIRANYREIRRVVAAIDGGHGALVGNVFSQSVSGRWLCMERATSMVWDRISVPTSAQYPQGVPWKFLSDPDRATRLAAMAAIDAQFASYSAPPDLQEIVFSPQNVGIMADDRLALVELGYGPLNDDSSSARIVYTGGE